MAYFHTNVLDNQIKALPTVDTASGSVASFDTDLTENLIECVCEIQYSQASGTPTPDNPIPITVYNEMNVGIDKVAGFYNFNQLAKPISNDNYNNNASTVSYSEGVATITSTGDYSRIFLKAANNPIITANHVYLVTCNYKTNYEHQVNPINMNVGGVYKNRVITPTPNVWATHYEIIKATSNAFNYMYFGDISNRYESGNITDVKNIQLIDLTVLFGTTIADYIYTLESNNAGAGVAYFRSLFPNDYYDYTASTIATLGTINNDGTGHTYIIPFGQTVAKGTLNVTTGVLEITHKAITLDGTQAIGSRNWRPQTNSVGWIYSSILTDAKRPLITSLPDAKSDKLQTVTYNDIFNNDIDSFSILDSGAYILAVRVRDTSLTTDTAINTWLAQNPITIMYEVDTPQVIQLNANQITALLNENKIWCDTNGDTSVKFLLTVGKKIA